MQPENPKVFVSHASEDKVRFVLNFATRLRSKGIDAWVDRWEMLPGDSIVDKIFEEGIAQAQAMIVVVSEHSVNKPWVREELNAGMVRKINGVSELIPVVIGNVDESQIPEALKATVWERVADLSNYDSEFETIVRAVYGYREKPELGDAPAYARMQIDTVPGLEDIDSVVLKLCGDAQMQSNTVGDRLSQSAIFEECEKMGFHRDEVRESLEVLDRQGYVRLSLTAANTVSGLAITGYGFEEYARTYMPGYDAAFRTVALDIVNHERMNSNQIAAVTGLPGVLVQHVLHTFTNRGYIKTLTTLGGVVLIQSVSPELKRWLRAP